MNEAILSRPGCRECAEGKALEFDFTMAFQPIVDLHQGRVFAHEALVRGLNQEPAGKILARVNDGNRYRFDQTCRVKAISLAAQLGLEGLLSINFLPHAIYRPETCIRTTLDAAQRYGFPQERIIFEVTEGEQVQDHAHLIGIFDEYKRLGFRTAIDDFGAGYSGLNLLAEFQPDIVKLDMVLVRNINADRARRAIVRGIADVCRELGITLVAEGIETLEEKQVLLDLGIHLQQGFLYARPAFQAVAELSAAAFE